MGIPVEELRIDLIDWSHRGEYIRTRRRRRRDDTDIQPEWATEAAVADANRLLSTRGSRSGRSIRVVGWSPSARLLLTVILVPKDLNEGEWWGTNAWLADERDGRGYHEQE